MNSKPWWQSKTIWVNVATLAVAAASGTLGIPIPQHVAVPVLAIANVVLRLMTNQGVSATDPLAQP